MSTGQATYYLSLHSGLLGSYKIHISQLDLQSNGKAATQPASLADGEVASEDLILYEGNNAGTPLLVWTDKTFKTVKINVIGSKQVTTVSTAPRAGEAIDKIALHAAGAAGLQPHFLIHYQSARSHWAEVFHTSGSKVSKAFVLPHVEGRGAFSACSLADEVYFSRYTSSEVSLYSSRRETVLSQWSLRHETSGLQDPVHGVSEVIMRAGAKYSLRSALALPAGDWTLVRNGDVLWSRPEGLAGIVAAAFVDFGRGEDLLHTLALEGQRNVFGAYIRRVTRHINQIQHIPHWLRGLPGRILPALFEGQADTHALSPQDEGFGFSKLIIVATEGGRIAAIDSGQHGKVLWSVQAAKVPDGQVWSVLSIEPEENSVLIRGSAGESLRVSTSTGAVSDYQPGAPTSSLRTSIPICDSHGRKQLIPINRDGSLGDISNMNFVDGTVIVTEGDDDVVRGWRLSRSSKNTLAWQFNPGDGERVQSVQPRPSHNPVASIGKVLGDRNVLYKYLNPNLILIVTTAVERSTANTYVIDSVSGAVLHSSTHTGVDTRQPISSVLTENWLAYSLFSESGAVPENSAQIEQKAVAGYQLIISEMFESRFPNDRGPLDDSANFSSIRPISADEAGSGDIPHVISQTFLLPGPIAHMTTTSTLQGITPQSLLCALPQTQALLSIPRYFIDPRRPVGRDPSPVEAEEGLFKYSPLLEFEPKWLLNHKRELLGISSVITSPSKLESTSLVFAYGDADIFGSRVSPIGSFDMLGKGFSKLQLIGTVVALAAGTSLLAPFVSFSKSAKI